MTTNILKERLDEGPVICAEGFLFEIERRGYMASGEFVPMVSLDHPEVLENLHREFQHAGSDIVEAFTYNATMPATLTSPIITANSLTPLVLARVV